jgi:hypothetical protein
MEIVPQEGFSTVSETPISPMLIERDAPDYGPTRWVPDDSSLASSMFGEAGPRKGGPATGFEVPLSRAIMISHDGNKIVFTKLSAELAGLKDYSEDTDKDLDYIVEHLNNTLGARMNRLAIVNSVGRQQPLVDSLNTIAIAAMETLDRETTTRQISDEERVKYTYPRETQEETQSRLKEYWEGRGYMYSEDKDTRPYYQRVPPGSNN